MGHGFCPYVRIGWITVCRRGVIVEQLTRPKISRHQEVEKSGMQLTRQGSCDSGAYAGTFDEARAA
jgi:hypothetical protein